MTYKVGLRTLFYTDDMRLNWHGTGPRPLLVDVWYPAAPTAHEAPVLVGEPEAPLFRAGHAARGANLPDDDLIFPLIMISHGTGGAAVQLGWLASALAAQGYIVAGVNHHGNTAVEPYTPQGFARVWERPQDLTLMLDRLLDDPIFGSRIDLRRVGAAGFSIGGYTALALAGGVLDLHALQAAYRASGRPLASLAPPEFPDAETVVALLTRLADEDSSHRQSYCDGRVRAAFVIAPAFGEAFTAAGLAPIIIPVKIVAGAADTNTPPSLNAVRYTSLIKQADLVILDGQVGHYTFLAESTPLGQRLLPELCVDHPSIDRAAIHQQVSQSAVEFFERHLTG